MILFLRALPSILALWLFACYVVALRAPATFWFMAAAAIIIPISGLRMLTRRATLPRRFGSLALFPALLTLGSFGGLLFSEFFIFQVITASSVTFLLWLFWEQAFRFTHQPVRYQKNALTNLAQLSAIAAFFFFVLVLFDLALFAGLSLAILAPILLVFVLGWFASLAYLVQADHHTTILYGTVISLVGLEFFILMQTLPPLPSVKAGVMVVIVGSCVQFFRQHFEPQEGQSWWPFGVLGLVLFSLLVTARWFA